tara:strand:- start:461 stop:868 length:408 start_codon:yes stop_codon:yes gene_type:complete
MTNFFKGLQNLVDKIFIILIIINIAWYFVSDSTYPSPEGLGSPYIETKEMLVFVSSVLLLVFGAFINWVLGSFVFELKEESRNTERLIKIEMTVKKIEEAINKIDDNVKNIKSEVEIVKERQINTDNKKNQKTNE